VPFDILQKEKHPMQNKDSEFVRLEDQAGEGIIDITKLSADHEPSSSTRKLTGTWAIIVTVITVVSSLFHFYTAGYRPLPSMQQRPIHIAFMFLITFLIYPFSKKSRIDKNPGIIDVILALAAAGTCLYLAYSYEIIAMRGGYTIQRDIIAGILFCILLVEAGRRVIGPILLILASIFLSYLFVGPYMPGILQHGGFSFNRVVTHMYMSVEGIFGIAIGVSATYVYLFILFGAFLSKSGTTKLFASLSLAVAGHRVGGPAKVAVIASGLMGTIQGSSAANVAATGMFTIPLMKSLGFKGYFAAAVEAVASCGGQFLPPVMGASAFIMAEYLSMPYSYVAAGAILPALLYYAAVYYQVHLRAKKLGMKGIPRNRLPALKGVLIQEGHLFIPIALLIALLVMQFTALFAAFASIIAVVVVSSIRKETRMNFKDIIEALELGAKNAVSTAIACAVVGFVVGSVSLSGLGMLFTHSLIKMGGGMLLPTLIIAAAASLILSMGLPTTSVYIITATLVAPGLVAIGTAPIVAHLFCYYWGGVSAITPPVALAAYVGAGIAGADVMKTGFTAMRLGIAAYIVPFYFMYWPALVTRENATLTEIIFAMAGGLLTIFCIGIIGERFLFRKTPYYKLGLLGVAIVLIMYPSNWSHIVAVVIAAFVGVTEYLSAKKEGRL
jgi:TRAP transporter 4TM/12TM fusion protein